MNKSITAFILGLVFSIIGLITAFVFWLVFTIIGAFTTGMMQTMCTVMPLINIFSFIPCIVGCCFCFAKRKVGGIIMLVGALIGILSLTILFFATKLVEIRLFLFTIPSLLMLIPSFIAMRRRKAKLITTEKKD